MNYLTITYILVSITMSCIAQILLKTGMSSKTIQEALNISFTSAIPSIFSNLYVIGGLLLYFLGAVVWLFVLSKIDVSKAYPFVGLGFILTMLFAYFFLQEPLTILKVSGTTLVVIGVLLISK